jgi:5-methylcytosine-specific restriction enzyme A
MPDKPAPIRSHYHKPAECRPSAYRRGYDRTWQRLAEAVLSDEPLCRMCKDKGLRSGATLVDHIKPIEDGGPRLDRNNLQPLCRDCHATKTGVDIRTRRATNPH